MTTKITIPQECSLIPGDLDRMEAVYSARTPIEMERRRAYQRALYPESVWVNHDVIEANRRHFERGG